jgi:hypothetical protein
MRLGMLDGMLEPRSEGTPEKLGPEMAISRWKLLATSLRQQADPEVTAVLPQHRRREFQWGRQGHVHATEMRGREENVALYFGRKSAAEFATRSLPSQR